jgi:hypothetical protein
MRAMTSPTETLDAVFEAHDRARRQRINRRNIRIRECDFLALGVGQPHDRAQILAARAALLRIEHHGAREARDVVDLARDGDAVDEVLELDHTGDFGHDRVRMRIPIRDRLSGRHDVGVVDGDRRAVRNLVALALAAELVDHAQFARTRHRDQMALLVPDGLDVVQADRALRLDLDAVGRRRSRGRAADVEGTHRELRARLADRLRRDDADRFADVDAMTAAQVAAVALRADAVARLASDRGAHLTWSTPIFSSSLTSFSSIKTPALTSTSPLEATTTSSETTRPSTRSPKPSTTSPPSTIGVIDRPLVVPQSISVTTRSCATSTSRRVR